jgi:hypothetical protein
MINGDRLEFSTGKNNYSKKFIGGGYYYILVNDPTQSTAENPKVTVSWGAGATYNNPGTQTTLYPRIKLSKGGWLAIMDEQQLVNSTVYSLPGDELLSDYEAGSTFVAGDGMANSTTVGYINYTIFNPDQAGTNYITGIDEDNGNINGQPGCAFNSTRVTQTGPAIVLVEEKQIGLGETDGRGVCVPLTTWSTSPTRIAINQPVFIYPADDTRTGFSALLSPDSHISQAINKYGTFVEYNKATNTGYKVTMKYPDEQMIANIYFAEVGA